MKLKIEDIEVGEFYVDKREGNVFEVLEVDLSFPIGLRICVVEFEKRNSISREKNENGVVFGSQLMDVYLNEIEAPSNITNNWLVRKAEEKDFKLLKFMNIK